MCDTHHTHDNSPHKGLQHEGHDQEHTQWSRRAFMQALGLAGAGTMFLGSHLLTASAPSTLSAALAAAESDNSLNWIRRNGGNDGLSTVIPIQLYDAYANGRPNIYVTESKVLKLTKDFGVPTYRSALESLWGDGQFKAVHGVGYEHQNI